MIIGTGGFMNASDFRSGKGRMYRCMKTWTKLFLEGKNVLATVLNEHDTIVT